MELRNGITLKAGSIHGTVFGGQFRRYLKGTRRLVGVKMAAEINHPCEVSIPTEDFSTPGPKVLTSGIMEALDYMNQGNDLYVGCMGGIGRTGIFMGVLFKAVSEYNGERVDPVKFVRDNYQPSAIETDGQQRFVREFDTKPIVHYIRELNNPLMKQPETTLWGSVLRFWGFERK